MPDIWKLALTAHLETRAGAILTRNLPVRRLVFLSANKAYTRILAHAISIAFAGTKFRRIVTIVSLCRKLFATLITLNNSSPTLPKGVFLTPNMLANMGRPRNEDKVFYPIVRLISIDMVNKFIGGQWSPKMIAHCKAVLRDIVVLVRVWMAAHLGISIPPKVSYPSWLIVLVHLFSPIVLCQHYITPSVIGQGGSRA